jgi:hypothetical protein
MKSTRRERKIPGKIFHRRVLESSKEMIVQFGEPESDLIFCRNWNLVVKCRVILSTVAGRSA